LPETSSRDQQWGEGIKKYMIEPDKSRKIAFDKFAQLLVGTLLAQSRGFWLGRRWRADSSGFWRSSGVNSRRGYFGSFPAWESTIDKN